MKKLFPVTPLDTVVLPAAALPAVPCCASPSRPAPLSMDMQNEGLVMLQEALVDLAVVSNEVSRLAPDAVDGSLLDTSETPGADFTQVAASLESITGVLSQGLEELRKTEVQLSAAREALALTQHQLATARLEETQARKRALHDHATGLPNRSLFNDHLKKSLALAERHGWTVAVMFVDLDRFKPINDTYGHFAGDRVISEVARRLSDRTREEDTVCRYGGDEFLLMLVNPGSVAEIDHVAHALGELLAQPIEEDFATLSITASIGIASYPHCGNTVEQLVKSADDAMYRAKRLGGGTAAWCCTIAKLDSTKPVIREDDGAPDADAVVPRQGQLRRLLRFAQGRAARL